MSNYEGKVQSSYSRVWAVENPGSPAATLLYLGCAKAGDPSWPLGGITRVQCPDPGAYDKFITTKEIRGERGRVSFSIMARYDFGYSDLLRLARAGCEMDFHVLLGICDKPNDYRSGWLKMLQFPRSAIEQYALENLGAIESGERNPTNENVDATADEMYELGKSAFENLCASTVVRELVSVDVEDNANCGGDCGAYDAGCQDVFAVMLGTGATPGTLPAVVYSSNGGTTCGSDNITTMFSNETPTDSEIIGDLFAVIAATSNSIHYKDKDDILAGVAGSWQETTTGFAGISPRAIWAADSQNVWIVGDSGYIWFSSDIQTSVTAVDAGSATTSDFRDVHGVSPDIVVAVGANNAVVFTTNGETFTAVTGPTPGVGINTVYVYSDRVWLVGTAAGTMYYTLDQGATWTQTANLPGSPSAIDKIRSPNGVVFYAAYRTSATGRILKSTAYGASGTWYVMPETKGNSIPAADRINDLAVCKSNPNVVYGAGLADDASDGVLVKAS